MAIPQFGLYGETAMRPEPGFVHIEDIATRSREVNWRIKPHRHSDLFQLVCVDKGRVTVQLDDESPRVAGGTIVTIPAGVVHGFAFEPHTRGRVLTVANALLDQEPATALRQVFNDLRARPGIVKFKTRSVFFGQYRRLLSMLDEEYQSASIGRDLMLERIAGVFLMALAREARRQALTVAPVGRADALLDTFRGLLDVHYTEHWTVEQYAQALHTSVSSLNRCCSANIGLTAGTIIRNRLLLEAKRRLIYTQDSVDAVAFRLGFKDAAYFSRFFRRLEGVPPGRYRAGRMTD